MFLKADAISFLCYSLPIFMIHSEHGNKQERKIQTFFKQQNHKITYNVSLKVIKTMLFKRFLQGLEAFRFQACEEPQ